MFLSKYSYDEDMVYTDSSKQKEDEQENPKITKTIQINFKVTYESWDEKKLPTKRELTRQVREFLKGYTPMTKSSLGGNSGQLKIDLY